MCENLLQLQEKTQIWSVNFQFYLLCSNISIIFSLKIKVKTKIKMSIHFIWAIKIYDSKSNNFPIIFLLMTWHSIWTWQIWWERCWIYKQFVQLLSTLSIYTPIVTSGNGYPLVEVEDPLPQWVLRVGSLWYLEKKISEPHLGRWIIFICVELHPLICKVPFSLLYFWKSGSWRFSRAQGKAWVQRLLSMVVQHQTSCSVHQYSL